MVDANLERFVVLRLFQLPSAGRDCVSKPRLTATPPSTARPIFCLTHRAK